MHLAKGSLKSNFAVFLIYIFVAFVFFNTTLFIHANFLNKNYIYPRTFLYSGFKHSFLWDPSQACGFPLLADINSRHLFSPFTILLYFFQTLFKFSDLSVFNVIHAAYFTLAGFFTYLYARTIGMRRLSAFLSGQIYGFSIFLIKDVDAIPALEASVWVGLILFYIEKIFKYKSSNYINSILAGICLGMQLLSGAFQEFFYFSIFLFFYFIFKYFSFSKNWGSMVARIRKSCSFLILIFIVGSGIAAIQLIPTMELAKESARLYFDNFNTAYSYDSLSYKNLMSTIFFNSDYSVLYLSLVPFLLATLTILQRKKEQFFYFYIFAASLFLFLCNKNLVSAAFYNYLPFFTFLKNHIRAFFLFIFAISILAGLGLNKIKSNLFSFFIVLIFVFQYYPFWRQVLVTKYLGRIKNFSYEQWSHSGINGFMVNDKEYHVESSRVFVNQDYVFLPRYKLFLSHGVSDLILSRYLEFSNTSLSGIDALRGVGYTSFLFYPNFVKLSNTKYIVLDKSVLKKDDEDADEFKKVAGYLDQSDLFEKIYEDNITAGYLFKNSLPRAFFVTDVFYIPDKQTILDILKNSSFDPLSTVIFEEYLDKPYLPLKNNELSVKAVVTKYAPHTVEVSLSANSQGFLVLLDTYYPGWKAYIDNEPARIYRADYLFRAIYIDKPGNHTIRFIYSPFTFKLGASVTFITLIGCIIGWRVRARRNPR